MKNNTEELIKIALEGNESAFESLLRPHRSSILNLALKMTGNMEDAMEIAQETIIKIFKYLHSFQSDKNFRNWVLKIVVNSTHDFWKKRKRDEGMMEEHKRSVFGLSSENPEKRLMQREIREKINSCLKALSPKERSVFLLRDGEGMSIQETSSILGYSSASVRTHLCRARKKIRERIQIIYPACGHGERK
ncbi:RNA polymerase sigma factor [Acidobacteriota bacterium]